MASPNPRPDPAIVSIDYGTTLTGVAQFERTPDGEPGAVTVVQLDRLNPNYGKVPSRVAYASDNNGDPKSTLFSWGAGVVPGARTHTWTKLRLGHQAPETMYVDQNAQRMAACLGLFRHLPRSPVTVVANYLGAIYREFLQNKPAIDFWITYPANWPQSSLDDLKKAVKLAGIGTRVNDKVSYISEPEAALWSLKGSNLSLKRGDGVLVCDCGGGTIDVETYRLPTPDVSGRTIKIGWAQGIQCAGSDIDLHFYDFLRERFGEAFIHLPLHLIGPGSPLMNGFEELKRAFRPGFIHKVWVPLEMQVQNPKEKEYTPGKVWMLYSDFPRFFDPVVGRIIDIIEDQIKAATTCVGKPFVKNIVLVGGLCQSLYIQDKIRAKFETENMMVTIPPQPQMAVVRGAVMRGITRPPPE